MGPHERQLRDHFGVLSIEEFDRLTRGILELDRAVEPRDEAALAVRFRGGQYGYMIDFRVEQADAIAVGQEAVAGG